MNLLGSDPRVAGLLLAVASLVPGLAAARDFEFEEPSYMPLVRGSGDIAAGDVNGDGLDDLVLTNIHTEWVGPKPIYTHWVDVYLQREDESLLLVARRQLPGNVLESNPVRMVDLDADGSSEIVVGHIDGISVLDWNGAGSMTVRTQVTGRDCLFIVSADVDIDHDQDVVCQSILKANSIDIFYGDGRAGFVSVRNMPTSAIGGTMQMQVKDVTADGRPDLLIASTANSYLLVYPHDGTDAFLPAFAYAYPSGYFLWPSSVEVVDTDGDGNSEVIVATHGNVPASNLLVYRRAEDGFLSHAATVPTKDGPSALIASDIDRDGLEDLVVGHHGWDLIGIYHGGPQGLSIEEKQWRLPFDGDANQLTLGDLNHDGCTDLIAASGVGYVLARGKCKPHKPMNDFSGDWTSDLLWRNPTTGQNAIWKSGNNATQQGVTSMSGSGWSIKATGDFNGDRRTDIVWHDSVTGNGVIWKSGNSQTTQALTRITDPAWIIVGAGDFDGDGKADLLWRNTSTGANAIWKSGNFATQQTVMGVTDANWRVAGVGDFDGDGKADLLWRHAVRGANTIWKSGNYQNQQATTAVTSIAWQVGGVGDFDGDGKADIFWRHSAGNNVIWKSGNNATQQAVASRAPTWKLATIGEYNRDSKDDLVWRDTATGQNAIWHSGDVARERVLATVANQDWKIAR